MKSLNYFILHLLSKNKRKTFVIVFFVFSNNSVYSEACHYWQQKVNYDIKVDMDVNTNRMKGSEVLEYWNNSPDTLYRFFYHLYWNAFQPGSMMDHKGVKKSEGKWISNFNEDEIGYQRVLWIKLNGVLQKTQEYETILEVILAKPILPHSKVILELAFEAQVPLAVDRSGRDNVAGVRYSIGQWYPKVCEYDKNGWHADPFIGNAEFYGVWGDFHIQIAIDRRYILGGTGYLQNAEQIGYGYEVEGMTVRRPPGDKLIWKFFAPNVHDFMWAADPDYVHMVKKVPGGPLFHIFYQRDSTEFKHYRFNKSHVSIEKYWEEKDRKCQKLANALATVYPFVKKNFGEYPYKQFSIIQAGVGNMEYAMATTVAFFDFKHVFHEFMHSWYQGALATNEVEHAWLDEGFASYATHIVYKHYKQISNEKVDEDILKSKYETYFRISRDAPEPLATWADHYNNYISYIGMSYGKGFVFLEQLGYIVGKDILHQILIEYFHIWKFKHPDPEDFVRVAEKISGLQLRWYKMYWISTNKTIDYRIDTVYESNGNAQVRLQKINSLPMPIDLLIHYKDGSKELLYIPMYLMFGSKPHEIPSMPRRVFAPWNFTHLTYEVPIGRSLNEISSIEIDPTLRMADVNRDDNVWKNK